MDHPLVSDDQREIRQRVVQLLRQGYRARRSSNFVFVCGGNEAAHMRMLFRDFCRDNLEEFEIFVPESAMDYLFSADGDEPFDISDFEQLISDLSHATVIFPEAAGSYAETGYFSAVKSIARNCILVLDSNHQQDSFISLGPAKKINSISQYQPVVQIDYKNPNFDQVVDRIRRLKTQKYKKTLSLGEFNELDPYEISCLVHQVVNIMQISTIEDLLFMFKVMFKNRFSRQKVTHLASVLVGAGYLTLVGEYGHMRANPNKPPLLEIRDGHIEEEEVTRLNLAEMVQQSDPEFLAVIEAS